MEMPGEMYIKTAQGEYILDRRSASMDLQQSVLKILSKVETMENNIELKLEAVKEKISNLDEKVFNNISAKAKQIEDIEKKLSAHCDDEDEINDVLSEHDKKWQAAET